MNNYPESIRSFSEQFGYKPEIKNEAKLVQKEKVIIAGMGGSRLAGDILKMWKPEKEILVHSDYNLPAIPRERLNDSLVIANSFSGNTEETIDSALKAVELGLSLAIVATGGKLIDIAKENGIPYVQLPAGHLQPRTSIGLTLLAMLKLLGDDDGLSEAALLKNDGRDLEEEGKVLAEVLQDKVPVIYTSERNMELGYIWKVILNETAKIPAFCNRFPELNHNEIAGFTDSELSKNFHFVFLRDIDDDRTGRIGLRMEKLGELYEKKGLPVTKLELKGESHLKKIFSSIILAHWTAYYLAKNRKVDPEKTDIIEDFKKML